MIKRIASVLIFAFTLPANADSLLNHLPNQLNLEVQPIAATATSPRSMGFGFSLEKLNLQTSTITGISAETLFPVFQQGKTAHIDLNGGFTMLAATSDTHFLGGKIGIMMNHPERQIAFMALAFRVIPKATAGKESGDWHFAQWVTKELDAGIHAVGKPYIVLRFGFHLL